MDIPDEKPCTGCGVTAPLSSFYRDAAATDGRQSRCKDCHRSAVRAYRERLKTANDEREPDLDGLRRCSSCGVHKPGREFHRNRSTRDGLHWVCKPCNVPSKEARRRTERKRRFRTYSLSPEEVVALFDAQDGRCAICQTEFDGTDFHVDHCHKTGRVRGLLCRSCNTALGLLRDEIRHIAAAIRYLEAPPMERVREA